MDNKSLLPLLLMAVAAAAIVQATWAMANTIGRLVAPSNWTERFIQVLVLLGLVWVLVDPQRIDEAKNLTLSLGRLTVDLGKAFILTLKLVSG